MCLVLLALDKNPEHPFILVANRDEFYARPTQSAHFWRENPYVLGGRDLELGGTWLGINKNGRFAAVTNIRDPKRVIKTSRSRGELTREFLLGEESAEEYYKKIQPDIAEFNGFNLLFGSDREVHYLSSEDRILIKLSRGIYGLSNAGLDTPWPKVAKTKEALAQLIDPQPKTREILELMTSRQQARDDQLPNTGVGLDWERLLSSRFIHSLDYGTRSTTVLTITPTRTVRFMEQSYLASGEAGECATFQFKIEPTSR